MREKSIHFDAEKRKGFVYLSDEALDVNLYYCLHLALDFNPLSKASKRKSSKKLI
ncbi:hypothetical protein [Polaribacter sp. SA4-10]|uniref:hypothetical protein n=1 Tax=Polaribacter sp. SA4-10 TaxID=754397 RepID=UPI0012FC3E6E|nr:hypothetical protein [Polaribacter sp. SA4-10]